MSTFNDKADASFTMLQKDILQYIQNKVFVGRYIERRYIESLQTYRDIILIESSEEIVKNLMQTKNALEKYQKNKWIGITNDPQSNDSNDCLLWVQLNNVPVGKHWFQMRAIRFEACETILEVQHIQHYRNPEKSFNSDDSNFPSFDLKEIFTYHNIRQAIIFSTVVLMTIFTFTVEAIKYLGDYIIRLSHVLINFIHVMTPIFFSVMEFLTKCVGGLFWFIYVMLKGSPNTPAVPNALFGNQRPHQVYKPIEYRQNYVKQRQSYSPRNWNQY